MEIYGIDFTSAPSRSKPITQAVCRLSRAVLRVDEIRDLYTLADFELLQERRQCEWIAAMDFPFSQPRKLIQNLNWPESWDKYVPLVGAMTRREFVACLRAYQGGRAPGDKRHFRVVDRMARACSPMQLDFTPVAQMFYEGATRLQRAPVNIIPFRNGGEPGTVVEGYPALVARRFIGAAKYKIDGKPNGSAAMRQRRRSILEGIQRPDLTLEFQLSVSLPPHLAQRCIEDDTGDKLDAVLRAMQAGWAYRNRSNGYGVPPGTEPPEGWISDPALLNENADAKRRRPNPAFPESASTKRPE